MGLIRGEDRWQTKQGRVTLPPSEQCDMHVATLT